MLDNKKLKMLAIQSGKPLAIVTKFLNKAIKDARDLNKQDDDYFVLEILNSYLGLDEATIKKTKQDITSSFLESSYTSISNYLDDLANDKIEETIMSTGMITPSDNPIAVNTPGGNPNKMNKKRAKDYQKDYPRGDLNKTPAEQLATKIGFNKRTKGISAADKRDIRSTDKVIKAINKESN